MSSETPHAPPPPETLHPGHAFKPYIPASANLPELTLVPLVAGTVLGVVFGASSLYLVLKVGLTVSASIPVAVISIALFRVLSKFGLRNRSILENNIVQTAGSAGESIAFGIGVTMPAIMILGFDLELTRVALVSVLGGLLGILMMIPLRRALIVEQHGILKYPEGTACAEVLKAGASEESRAAAATADSSAIEVSGGKTIFAGFVIGLLYKVLMSALKLWKEVPEKIFAAPLKTGSIAAEISPELLGVGYIIGPKIASVMCAGGVLAYLVLIPAISFFGGANPQPLAPGLIPIGQMAPDQIRAAYVLYIGAGAVATGGVVSLVRALPTIWQGLRGGLGDLLGKKSALPNAHEGLRTDQDLSIKFVGVGLVVLIAAIVIAPRLNMNLAGALLIVLFGFIFVTVSSRLTGEIGSSSNPISGMTVATLLLTCAIFLLLGWTGPSYYVTALSVGAIVCIAASNGGTTSQDLKTGFLIGATPRLQQISILVGAFASALLLGPILLQLNDAATVYVTPVSFEHVAQQSPLSAGRFAALPRYEAEQPQEKADYRLLALPTAEAGLLPGEYLVDPPEPLARAGDSSHLRRRSAHGRVRADSEGKTAGAASEQRHSRIFRVAKDRLCARSAWEIPSRRGRPRRLPDRSRDQRHASRTPRRLARDQVQRAQGNSDLVHHQGDFESAAALGAGAPGRDDRRGAGAERHPLAGVRGRRISTAVVDLAHLRRRPLARPGGPVLAAQECRTKAERRGADRGGRQEPRRAAGFGLHRGWGHRRHRDCVHGRCAQQYQSQLGALVRRPQSVLRG